MMKRPLPLRPGASIAILSPASVINPDYVDGAAATIRRLGYRPLVMPHTLGRSGSYSATAADRLADLTDALTDPSIRAIICSRGGYGAVHLLLSLATLPIESAPKWLVGFSDISALHALMQKHGVQSIHAPMMKHI
ncbi:MAG: LD-carboxypeptidase, partial [Muribaculaceae bacterium]|nr:LD-carboxypeptidase [Muribaculaceae bacterium]